VTLSAFGVEGWEHYDKYRAEGKKLIYCFWHNQILYGTYFFVTAGLS